MTTEENKKSDLNGFSEQDGDTDRSGFKEAVSTRARRKEWARANPTHPLWNGFSLFGIVGWSVSVPTLLGIALGVWLDHNHAATHSWTLTMLTVGLVLGCFNAWRWISREERNIHNNDPAEEDEQGE
ncbi:MAG: AtpZ/AtpI family protein [Desulfuromonadaceae bacterium]|nr:AtpZ/AtpI family protein [Desulfuromonas sp.]MDY0185494.1 AtpZ/AtpI family protein [Desulfuromonadaceae bacterium]